MRNENTHIHRTVGKKVNTGNKVFARLLALTLCVLTVISCMSSYAFAAQADDKATENNVTINATNVLENEPPCSCGNELLALKSHSDNCDRKSYWKQAAEILDTNVLVPLWSSFASDVQEWILTYLSWTDTAKHEELKSAVGGGAIPDPVELESRSFLVSGKGLDNFSLSAVNGETEQNKTAYFENTVLHLSEAERAEGSFAAFELNLLNDNGESVQPNSSVRATIGINVGSGNDLYLYHLFDDAVAINNALSSGKEIGMRSEPGLSAVFAKECEAALIATGEADTIYFEVLSTENGSVINNGDGTISFTTDSFSYYWTWSSPSFDRYRVRSGDFAISMAENNNKTLYLPYQQSDQTVYFRTILNQGSNGGFSVTATDLQGNDQSDKVDLQNTHNSYAQLTVKGGIPEGTTITVVFRSNLGTVRTVHLKIVRIPKEFIYDRTDIPVSIAILEDSRYIQSEPSIVHDSAYVRVAPDLSISGNIDTKYSTNAYDLIDKGILDNVNFIQNAQGSYVWGLVDATGVQTKAELNLTEEQYRTIVQNYLNYKYPGQGKNADDYRLIPYVIKVEMRTGHVNRDAFWYVDCVVVPKDKFTVSYQHNLEYGYEIKSGTLPDGKIVNAGGSVEVGNISSDFSAQKTVVTGYGTEATYTAIFKGWQDQDGNTYLPNDTITKIQKDIILYGMWEYPDQTQGNLRISKSVQNASSVGMPDPDQSFTFNVEFGAGTYDYAVFDAAGHQQSQGAIASGGTLPLKAGQYAILYNLPKDTTYTVTEVNVPEGYTAEEAKRGTIVAGNTQIAAFTNTYNGAFASLKVSKIIPDGTIGDRTMDFTYTLTCAELAGKSFGDLSFDTNGVATFTLRHGQDKTLALPSGVTYQLSEQAESGYTVSYKVDGGNMVESNEATLDLLEDMSIEFTNTKDVTSPTGLNLNNTSVFAFLFTGAALALVMLFFGGALLRRMRCK